LTGSSGSARLFLCGALLDGEAWSLKRGTAGELLLASSSTSEGYVFKKLLEDKALVALLGDGWWETSETKIELEE